MHAAWPHTAYMSHSPALNSRYPSHAQQLLPVPNMLINYNAANQVGEASLNSSIGYRVSIPSVLNRVQANNSKDIVCRLDHTLANPMAKAVGTRQHETGYSSSVHRPSHLGAHQNSIPSTVSSPSSPAKSQAPACEAASIHKIPLTPLHACSRPHTFNPFRIISPKHANCCSHAQVDMPAACLNSNSLVHCQ